eukprot:3187166-Ditylum_brightwellii.AAC.1
MPRDCRPSWSREHIIKAIQHGPHKSARSKEAIATLHEETTEKIRNGFARVVKYGDIKNNLPHNLKVSPVACIPHKSKSFRVILDLSFNLRDGRTIHSSVNETTTKQAAPESM